MKRSLIVTLILATLPLGACVGEAIRDVKSAYVAESDIPRTAKPFNDEEGSFQFVIVGDRQGGNRPGIFEKAMRQINWLQPEFVLSVGDLVPGYIDDKEEIDRQWQEFDRHVDQLEMMFFHVPGNHDVGTEAMRNAWLSRFGRDYYHFTYKDVLFIVLNTEDPPPKLRIGNLRKTVAPSVLKRASEALRGSRAEAEALFKAEPEVGRVGRQLIAGTTGTISDRQVEFVRRVAAENPRSRWTMVLMHKPGWKFASDNFLEIERVLTDRPYTMLAGHMHTYSYEKRHGRDYIQLGTTGGRKEDADPAAMDHVLWVTMKKQGPEFANIHLDGLYDRTGPAPHGSVTPSMTRE